MVVWVKYRLQELKENYQDLKFELGFLHDVCADVRKKRSAAKIAKANCGTDYEMAMKRLDIAKSFRRAYFRTVFGLRAK